MLIQSSSLKELKERRERAARWAKRRILFRKRVFLYFKAVQEYRRQQRSAVRKRLTNTESYHRGRIRAAIRATYVDRCQAFTDAEWRAIYRMSRSSMETLRNILAPFLEPKLHPNNIEGRAHGNRRPLTVDEKIMMSLQYLGGVRLGGLLHGFHTSRTVVYDTIWEFVKAVIRSNVGAIVFPETSYQMMYKAKLFCSARQYHPALYGCIGALDGLAIRIILPSGDGVPNQIAYINRKGFPSFNLQGIADADCRCIYLSVNCPGSTHDSTAWELSSLSKQWKENIMVCPETGRRFYLALDEAYSATDNQCCPWPGQGLGKSAP